MQIAHNYDNNTTISYQYNNKGQLISESDSAICTVKTYTYDSNGNRTGFTLTRNNTQEISQGYTYDKLNRLTEVWENGVVIATYAYDSKGNRTQTVSNGIATTYAYNLANILTGRTDNKLSESYKYYLNGNQKTKTSNNNTTVYEYDNMNRLVRENDTEYSFDDFGNRASMENEDVTVTYEYDKNNRLIRSEEVTGDTTKTTKYFFDYNGNQITKAITTNIPYEDLANADYTISQVTDENIAIYDYDCYNRLVGIDTNGVKSAYTYAPDGLRESKTVSGVTTNLVYDNANVVEEITATGVNKYIRGLELIKNGENVYYLYNGQGNVALLVDNTGATLANYAFDAYGNEVTPDTTDTNPFRYCGEYYDTETGLIYLRNRYYDPSIGAFITEDPIRDGINWYAYCGGNPVMLFDPLGLVPTVKESAAMASHIYGDYAMDSSGKVSRTVEGWRLIDVWYGRESMKMGIYIKDSDDWQNPSEYALVFKGTNNVQNWKNNAEAFFSSKSADVWDAMNSGLEFVNSHVNKEITFVGHSKGGGEAIATADYTDKNAITFNAANFKFKNYVSGKGKGKIDNYYVRGEILESTIGTSTIGKTHWLNTQYWMIKKKIFGKEIKVADPIKNHLMDAVINALKE